MVIALIEILIAAFIVAVVGTPLVNKLDKWKKEMDDDK